METNQTNTHVEQVVPFLHPHQINFIRKQLNSLISAFYFAGDYRVLAASRANLVDTLLKHCTPLTDAHRDLLAAAAQVRDKDELYAYMDQLAPYIIPFPRVTAAEIKKLFPKVKKLPLPDLAALDYSTLSYLGWKDISTNSLFLVHYIDGRLVGTECRYTGGTNKRSTHCHWCNNTHALDVALVTAQVKLRNVTDGYKTTGNYICLNSAHCNLHMTSTEEMHAFIASLRK